MLSAGWQVKVTVLEDNEPTDEYRYLLSVNTGHRRGASTSSQVNVLPFNYFLWGTLIGNS